MPTARTCTHCGAPGGNEALFCAQCGHLLPRLWSTSPPSPPQGQPFASFGAANTATRSPAPGGDAHARLSLWRRAMSHGWKSILALVAGVVVLSGCALVYLAGTATAPAQSTTLGLPTTPPTVYAATQPTAPARQPQPTATPLVSEQAKTGAVDLLGAAGSQRQAGQLGLAL